MLEVQKCMIYGWYCSPQKIIFRLQFSFNWLTYFMQSYPGKYSGMIA